MVKKLTKREEGFAVDWLDSGNGTQSVLKNYDVKNENVAGVMAHELLRKPKIQEFLEQNAEAVASNMLRLALKAKNEQVQVAAGKDVLDRAGFKPVERTVSFNIPIPIDDVFQNNGLQKDKEDDQASSLLPRGDIS